MTKELIVNCETGETQLVDATPAPLAEQKANLWASAKTLRDQKIDAGANVPGIGRFDSDTPARINIIGAVTGAQMALAAGQPFSVPWKLQDNSVTTLSAAQMLFVGQTVLAHVTACHQRAQVIGIAIDAAQDEAALSAIDIGAGWP